MSLESLISPLYEMILLSTPIIFATIGEIYAERSGILNLGIEGIMSLGAAIAFVIAYTTGNITLGIFLALVAGGLLALIHALVSINFNANQVISGLALAMLGLGLSSFVGKKYVGLRLELMLQPIKIPLLSSIPLIGPVFFNQDILVYTAYILTIALWFLLYKTKWGLYIRAVGENPYAADSMGINIYLVRYLCTVFGGMLAGLGGAYNGGLHAYLERRHYYGERLGRSRACDICFLGSVKGFPCFAVFRRNRSSSDRTLFYLWFKHSSNKYDPLCSRNSCYDV